MGVAGAYSPTRSTLETAMPVADATPPALHLFGHACLGIEAGGRRLLVDPWLVGSCYWRAWWHFPAPPELPEEWLAPDAIYLSHHHFDHFHYPSMRRLDRAARVYVPRFGVDVLRGELAGLGFHDVVELAHGEPRAFGDGARIASYQHGFDDSALVVADGDVVIVDLNDCKLRGRALRQVVRTFGRPTFMLRTHSWAQSYPIQYEAEDPADLELITDETFLRDFADAAAVLQPRYAVPFANMVAFLHPQAAAANDHLITPDRVQAACAADGRLAAVEVVPLGPGDSWRAGEGFARAGGPWWADREAVLARRADEVRPVLERTAAEEADRHLDFATFRGYLERFARDVPWPARRALGHRPIAFAAPWDEARPWWVLDLRRRSVRRLPEPPPERASAIHVDEAVLADAIANRILHMVHGSMRIRTELRPGGVSDDLGFWGLLMVWEIGYLPLRALPRRRFASVLVRRWREAADALAALLAPGGGSTLERLSGGFATTGSRRS